MGATLSVRAAVGKGKMGRGSRLADGSDWLRQTGLFRSIRYSSNYHLFHTMSTTPGADKKIVAGILGILLGALGIHKFYLGYTKEGVIMLLVSVLTLGFGGFVMGVIGLIEGILYLTKPDEEFVATYVTGKKGWF